MKANIVHPVLYVGIDVSEAYLDLYAEFPGLPKRIENTKPAITKLLKDLRLHPGVRVVCEATGRCEALLCRLCHQMELPIYVVNPQRVRAFACSQGELAKTDQIDARILCAFARVNSKLKPVQPLSPSLERLAALSTRRRQLLEWRTAENNRLRRADQVAQSSIRSALRFLAAEISRIDSQLSATVDSCPSLRSKVDTLTKVKGVGSTSAIALLAALPELGSISKDRAASLAGLAPFPRDSGKKIGRRFIQGGRLPARLALYMPALVASKHNPIIHSFYSRLRSNGKPPKLALTASMRKLLSHLNSLLKPIPLPS